MLPPQPNAAGTSSLASPSCWHALDSLLRVVVGAAGCGDARTSWQRMGGSLLTNIGFRKQITRVHFAAVVPYPYPSSHWGVFLICLKLDRAPECTRCVRPATAKRCGIQSAAVTVGNRGTSGAPVLLQALHPRPALAALLFRGRGCVSAAKRERFSAPWGSPYRLRSAPSEGRWVRPTVAAT